MPENDDFDDSGVDEEVKASDGWKNLRTSRDKLAKELAEARKALAEGQAAKRTNDLTALFKAKDVNEKAAKFYPTDQDVSDESVTKWLSEYADVFGVSSSNEQKPPETPANVEARKVAAAAANSPGTPPAGLEDVNARLKALDSKDPDFMRNLTEIMTAHQP